MQEADWLNLWILGYWGTEGRGGGGPGTGGGEEASLAGKCQIGISDLSMVSGIPLVKSSHFSGSYKKVDIFNIFVVKNMDILTWY